jgi:RNA polymerase sigma factor (sigma-70 family)
MEHLIDFRVNKYKKFSNYNDLKQDGFEALMLAFKTYDPKKGDFTWWANKYISTRVSRSANTHSTIRYPLKKTKTMQPYKVSKLPQMVSDENPLQQVENSFELELVMRAINSLPELQRQVIVMHHEFDGGKNSSLAKIAKALCISRGVCLDLLTQAQNKIKEQLSPYYE